MRPLVRLIVVNFNGGDMTKRCLERLSSLDWPRDRLQLVLVDNASTDGLADALPAELPHVQVIRSSRNLGFAGGANLGLRDLGEVEYVGFVNNDAFPEPDWLEPLVDALQRDASLGAVAPKILLAPRFLAVTLESPTFVPGGGDPRALGVMIGGVVVDGRDVFSEATFHGFHGVEHGPHGPFQWTTGRAEVWVPFDPSGPTPTTAALVVSGARATAVDVTCGSWSLQFEAGETPRMVEVQLRGDMFDVINNAGSKLVRGGWAGDRGYLERDIGQYDQRTEVFAWCGAAALLARRYLEDVGPFDEDLFLYYEDTDLSWRGRLRGWRYELVPESVVRHLHSATSGEGSALFNHYVDRNRLLVFLRNAPLGDVLRATGRFVDETVRITARDVVRPTIARRPRQTVRARQKARSLAAFGRNAPVVVLDRLRTRPKVSRSVVAAWAERT